MGRLERESMNYRNEGSSSWTNYVKPIGLCITVLLALIALQMAVLPRWNVWKQGLEGEAMLRKAEHEKRILIEQASAEVEAAKLRSQAIEAIGASIQKYPEYRVQEFIGAFATAMENGSIEKIIYVPTERNIPIVEVGQ